MAAWRRASSPSLHDRGRVSECSTVTTSSKTSTRCAATAPSATSTSISTASSSDQEFRRLSRTQEEMNAAANSNAQAMKSKFRGAATELRRLGIHQAQRAEI